ncbi:Hypothetical_protein [Hexamita inflata]|uniref:Hypothetical_protein n=1 Tax=Hexamita inflata TaxID=28002 RepID=A0AA86TL92_9EUKA|nr:Hypothetical protein HINF_LOCUS3888 [Hexamita inflata]
MTSYFDYSQCNNDCYNGYCNSTTVYDNNIYQWRVSYECVDYGSHRYNLGWMLMLLIPAVFLFIFAITCGCHKKKQQQRLAEAPQRAVEYVQMPIMPAMSQ